MIQMCAMTNGSTHLSTWVTAETKQRFSALAHELGLSESALLKRSVILMLRSTDVSETSTAIEPAKVPRDLRLYVRLRAEDHGLLGERAAARGMPAATYASLLLRSHLRALAPLPDRELAALKATVAELGAIGRNVNQIARAAHQIGRIEGLSRADLLTFIRVLEALRGHVKGLIRTNLSSWDAGRATRD